MTWLLRVSFCPLEESALHRDHLAGAVAHLPPVILTERHDFRRARDLQQGLLELLRPVRAGVQVLRHIALRERRVVVGQRGERNGWFLQDPPPVLGGDLALLSDLLLQVRRQFL